MIPAPIIVAFAIVAALCAGYGLGWIACERQQRREADRRARLQRHVMRVVSGAGGGRRA